jgi:hypothetical protein
MNCELESPSLSPARAILILVCGLLATWLAAGSLGWIAPPLQKALTWLALGTIVLLANRGSDAPRRAEGKGRFWAERGLWLLLAAAAIAVLMTASSLAVVNILAVAVLLATVALVRPGIVARAAGPVALAAATLAVVHLICEGTVSGWAAADAVGRAEGHWAALLAGRPLLIGASFGGIDFLVVMTVLAISLRTHVAPGADKTARFKSLALATLFIAAAQTAYLVVLAYAHDITDLLLPPSRPVDTALAHMGVWTWSDAARAMLPWHVPVLAAIFQTVVAVCMFRLTPWLQLADESGEETRVEPWENSLRDRRFVGSQSERAGKLRPRAAWMLFAPAAALLVAAGAAGLAPVRPDLSGRRIVAYDDGSLDWTTTDPGNVAPGLSPRYGLLPALVASLGGEFVVSKDLNANDLRDASVLIVLPPGNSSKAGADIEGTAPLLPTQKSEKSPGEMPYEIRQKIWDFVKAGGGLVVAGDPGSGAGGDENALNALLAPTAMSLRDDTANSLTERWECNLLAAPRAATATGSPGRSSFSMDRAASVRANWPAGPLMVGRWCWNELGSDPTRMEPGSNPPRLAALPYTPGSRLGDLVLAAQQNFGQGNIVVLGDAACLGNDGIPFSYTFCGPLLASLAQKDASPLAWWRQALAIVAAAAGVVLLFHRFDPLRLAGAAIALALAAIGCRALNDATAMLLPAAAKQGTRPVIYVDGSHLEAMGKDPWREDGAGCFMRVLAESGYLPLLAPDVTAARLKGARMLISIAPGRALGEGEIAAVNEFVQQGGIFLCAAGSPDAGPSRPLLDKFNLRIAPMPLPPWRDAPETEPLGAMVHGFQVPSDIARLPSGQDQFVRFHAAWPVSGTIGGSIWPEDDRHGSVIAGNSVGEGQAFLLGDSGFALQKGLAPPVNPDETKPPQNALFWRTTLRSWLSRRD